METTFLLALTVAALLSGHTKATLNQNSCQVDNLFTLIDHDGQNGIHADVPGPCPSRSAYSSGTSATVVPFSSLQNKLGGDYCISFVVQTNAGNTNPILHFTDFSTKAIGNITTTDDSVTYTLFNQTATFPVSSSTFSHLQLCVSSNGVTLYDDCEAIGSMPFSHAALSDINVIAMLAEPSGTNAFQGAIGSLYMISCTGPLFNQASIAALQCHSIDPNCTINGNSVVDITTVVSAYLRGVPALHCPVLSDPDHGSVMMTRRSINDTATYFCDDFYLLQGESLVTCTRNRSWSSPPPICTPTFTLLPVPTNGAVEYVARTDEILEAIFTCDAGYSLVGYPVLVSDQSSWNREPPQCNLIRGVTPPSTQAPGRVENVHSPQCGRLEWDAQDGVTYKLRFYTGPTFACTPPSRTKNINSTTNSYTFTAGDVPSGGPLRVIIKAKNSNGVHSHSWSTPIIAAEIGCLEN